MKNCTNVYLKEGPAVREAVKTLAANLSFSFIDKTLKTLVVTSSIKKEGKSTIALWTAIAMAESGKRTLIVNTDLRNPTLGKYLHLDTPLGLLGLLSGEATLPDVLQETGIENLWYLGTERSIAMPVEILGSERFAELVEGMKREFDFIVLDTPPVGEFVDAAILSANADATLLVVSRNRVHKSEAEDALEQLKKANAYVAGTAVNLCEGRDNHYYYGYYQNDHKTSFAKRILRAVRR